MAETDDPEEIIAAVQTEVKNAGNTSILDNQVLDQILSRMTKIFKTQKKKTDDLTLENQELKNEIEKEKARNKESQEKYD